MASVSPATISSMTGNLRAARICLLAALVTAGISSCAQTPVTGEVGETTTTVVAQTICSNPDLQIDSTATYFDGAGKMWVVGELLNTSDSDVLLPRICINVRADSGERTEQRYAGPILLKATERVGFHAVIDNPPTGGKVNVSFTADGQWADMNASFARTVYREFDVNASASLEQPDSNVARVTGVLTNTGSLAVTNIFVSVALYNAQNELVGVGEGKVTNIEALAPGDALQFAVTSSHLRQPATGLKLRVLAEGQVAEPNASMEPVGAVTDPTGDD